MERCYRVHTEEEWGVQVHPESCEVGDCNRRHGREATDLFIIINYYYYQSIYLFSRRFEGLVARGKSPTEELLNDWGTTNSTVGELVDILRSHKLLAAASVLLPGMTFFSSFFF